MREAQAMVFDLEETLVERQARDGRSRRVGGGGGEFALGVREDFF